MNYPIAVLISGGGTTLANLLAWRKAGRLRADLRLVISSNPEAGGLNHAQEAGIESLVIDHRTHRQAGEISGPLFQACRERGVQLVACGGFLRRLVIPPDFAGRVINIHPSLIPAFSGEGMYGMRVHEAVLEAGVSETGCTVHLVDDQYDHGPVLARRKVEVLPGDSPAELARRVFAAECELLPAVINAFAAGEVEVLDGQPVMPPSFAGARP